MELTFNGTSQLRFLDAFNKKTESECDTTTQKRAIYYKRMVGVLGDTRSVDPLVSKSLRSHRKRVYNYNPIEKKIREIISHEAEKAGITKDLLDYYITHQGGVSDLVIRRADDSFLTQKIRLLVRQKGFDSPDVRRAMTKHIFETLDVVTNEIKKKIELLVGVNESTFYIKQMSEYVRDYPLNIAINGESVLVTAQGIVGPERPALDLPPSVAFDFPNIVTNVPKQFSAPAGSPPPPQAVQVRDGIPSTNDLFLYYDEYHDNFQQNQIHQAISDSGMSLDNRAYLQTQVNEPGDNLEQALESFYQQGDIGYNQATNIYTAMGMENPFINIPE